MYGQLYLDVFSELKADGIAFPCAYLPLEKGQGEYKKVSIFASV